MFDEFQNLPSTPQWRLNKLRSLEHQINVMFEGSNLVIPVKLKVPKHARDQSTDVDYIGSLLNFALTVSDSKQHINKTQYINKAKRLKCFGEHLQRQIAEDERQERLDWVKSNWAELCNLK